MLKYLHTLYLLLFFSTLHHPAHTMFAGDEHSESLELLMELVKSGDYCLVQQSLSALPPDVIASIINAAPFCGKDTLLHEAVYRALTDIAELLIAHGADPSQPNEPGLTAIDAARVTGNEALIELFARHNPPTTYGKRHADEDMPPAKRKPLCSHN